MVDQIRLVTNFYTTQRKKSVSYRVSEKSFPLLFGTSDKHDSFWGGTLGGLSFRQQNMQKVTFCEMSSKFSRYIHTIISLHGETISGTKHWTCRRNFFFWYLVPPPPPIKTSPGEFRLWNWVRIPLPTKIETSPGELSPDSFTLPPKSNFLWITYTLDLSPDPTHPPKNLGRALCWECGDYSVYWKATVLFVRRCPWTGIGWSHSTQDCFRIVNQQHLI